MLLPRFGAGAPRCRVPEEDRMRVLGAAGLRSLRITKYRDVQHLGQCGGDVEWSALHRVKQTGQDGTCLGKDGSSETWPFCLSLEETFFYSCNPWLAVSLVTCSVLPSAGLARSP